ncbi:glycosyltransferase [Histomonas meleagridis]|uniref:glycosyltransferase n=1 Tax=Histomonas meleagridis TaxID=135588 RepID=UPI00355A9F82|nr:glycosyltransferase [Histomonas meleagridis]KAH0799372.1 glycosyltransferase [Histomonas meleagridis]
MVRRSKPNYFFIFIFACYIYILTFHKEPTVQFQATSSDLIIHSPKSDSLNLDYKPQTEPTPTPEPKDPNDIDVDIVYTYVDGDDPVWQARKKKAEEQFGIKSSAKLDKARYINIEEIRYSLRSVELFAPWVHHIFIVTDNQTIPFVKRNHPKITYIDHTQILPKFALPAYSAYVIEHGLINVPGLSEYFIYLNDDFFFSRPTTKWEFFDKETHLPIIYAKKNNWYNVHRQYNIYRRSNINDGDGEEFWASIHYTVSACSNKTRAPPRGEVPHTMFASTLTLSRKMNQLFTYEINDTLKKHFRIFPDFQYQHAVMQTCVAYRDLCKYVELEGSALYDNSRFFYYKGRDNPFEGINPKNSRSICINSALGVTEEYYRNAKKFLESFLSKKSSFESD